ncbi:max-binding protein MNT-like [Schistocerca piceifrons]|uniref:max-binding protein MNT-like n=1 Tax=Schistocerca piceifrons TaxID=274613 RepID=UPI001F5E8FC6|nr:max-binding protein MNT-like [Schistocerca piceifrons]
MGVLMLAVDAAAVHDCGRRRASPAAAASPPLEVKKEPDDEPYWMAPPPKKKWIRHYLRTEEEPSSTAAADVPAASTSPAPPTPPPPPPPPPPAVAAVRTIVPLPPPPPLPAAAAPLVHQLPPTHVHHLQLAPSPHAAAPVPAAAAASVSVVVPAPAPAPVPAPAAPAPATLTPPPAHTSAAATVPGVVVNGGLSPMEAAANAEDAKDFHKRTMGTREVHNKLEKNRRAHLKECFELLKKQLPPSPDEKKTSNLSILHSALRYIQVMRRKEREFEHEMERLAREKIAAQQRLANLKKELSAQWDHIDFNALLPETVPVDNDPVRPPRDTVSHTASTASAGADLSDGEETLQRTGPMYSSTSSLSSTATPGSPQQHATEDASTSTRQHSPRPTAAVATPPHQHALPPPPPTHHLQLPVSAHMVSAAPGLAAALVSPAIQLLASSGLRVLPAEPQPLSLTVHHPQSSSHHHAGVGTERLRESPTSAAISLPTLHLTNKMVALPGGAELNLLPANGTRKHPPLATITGGISLPNGVLGPHHPVQHAAAATQHTTHHHAGVTLATKSVPAGITHVVAPLGSHPAHTGLTPLVTPVTVVSQGSQQVAHILATPQPIGAAGKVMTTAPLLKSVGPMPLVNAQYLSAAALVKPVVVVSSPSQASALPPPHTTS